MILNAKDIPFETTAHGEGLKKVLLRDSDTPTMLTQFAYGKLSAGENVAEHVHDTMEEIFYFLAGEGIYKIDGDTLQVSSSTVVRIPAGVPHSLSPSGEEPLEFIYFGIATV